MCVFRYGGKSLIPYTCAFYFCATTMVSSIPVCLLLARYPGLTGPRVPSIRTAIKEGGVKSAVMPFLGAFVWYVTREKKRRREDEKKGGDENRGEPRRGAARRRGDGKFGGRWRRLPRSIQHHAQLDAS